MAVLLPWGVLCAATLPARPASRFAPSGDEQLEQSRRAAITRNESSHGLCRARLRASADWKPRCRKWNGYSKANAIVVGNRLLVLLPPIPSPCHAQRGRRYGSQLQRAIDDGYRSRSCGEYRSDDGCHRLPPGGRSSEALPGEAGCSTETTGSGWRLHQPCLFTGDGPAGVDFYGSWVDSWKPTEQDAHGRSGSFMSSAFPYHATRNVYSCPAGKTLTLYKIKEQQHGVGLGQKRPEPGRQRMPAECERDSSCLNPYGRKCNVGNIR